MAQAGRILYARDNEHWVFRFEGEIRYTLAHPLDAFVEHVFSHSQPASVTADLRDTDSIDSTGIGLLAKLARVAHERAAPRPTLFCGNREVGEVLDSVCLDRVYNIVDSEAPRGACQPLPDTAPTESELAGTIEHAHRLLSDLSEQNRVRFEGVLEAFSRLEQQT
ncbi:MAG: STAS domain-containing protein [Rhodocyclaceae bacterium]|nr:STAS domain-containing protein [Rhodocyclaceae bacterium]